MDSFERNYGIKENEVIKTYHRSRRMFCIYENTLYIADASVPYSHATWFEKMGWISASNDTLMNTITRGIVDKGGNIYFYVGYDFSVNEDAEKTFFFHLHHLVKKLNLDPKRCIFGGLIKKEVGETWPPRKKFGKIQNYLRTT